MTTNEMGRALSISGHAMLATLRISVWAGRKFDRPATNEFNDGKGAERDAGRYNKQLFGGRKHARSHAAVLNAASAARRTHFEHTLAWGEDGWRLLPTAQHQRYVDAMRAARGTFEAARETFFAEYETLVEGARDRLKDLYRPADYPSLRQLAGRFSFGTDFSPVPEAGDFRVELPLGAIEEVQRSVDRRVREATGIAMQDAWGRLYDVACRYRDRLTGPDGPDKGAKGPLVESCRDAIDLLGRLNVTGDPNLEAMRTRMLTEVSGFDSDQLKGAAGEMVGRRAAAIVEAMKGFYSPAVAQ